MICCTARNNMDVIDGTNLLFCKIEFRENHLASTFINPSTHRVAVCFRLLINFLKHKMIKTAFFSRYSIPFDIRHFPRNKIPLNSHQFDRIFCQYCHFTVVQDIHFTSIIQDGWNIRTDKVLSFANTDNKRACLTYCNKLVRFVFSQYT
ncbi:hypothetical protein D3C73_974760 [compost metagenome]